MTLSECLELEKESFLREGAGGYEPEKAKDKTDALVKRVLSRANAQVSIDRVSELTAAMLGCASLSSGLLDCVGDTRIWDSHTPISAGKQKPPRKALIALLAGAILLLALFLVLLSQGASSGGFLSGVGHIPITLLLLAAGMAGVFFAGKFWQNGQAARPSQTEQYAQILLDPAKIYRVLSAVMLHADQWLKSASSAQITDERQPGALSVSPDNAGDMDDELIGLMMGFLEASCSQDGDYALDKLRDVRHFLHKKGIETIDYSEENSSFFDVLPSVREGTLRPALFKEGKLLKKGLAAGTFTGGN